MRLPWSRKKGESGYYNIDDVLIRLGSVEDRLNSLENGLNKVWDRLGDLTISINDLLDDVSRACGEAIRHFSMRAYVDYVATYRRGILVFWYKYFFSEPMRITEHVLEPVDSSDGKYFVYNDGVFTPVIAFYDSKEAFEIRMHTIKQVIYIITKPADQTWAPLLRLPEYRPPYTALADEARPEPILVVSPKTRIYIDPVPKKILVVVAEKEEEEAGSNGC